MLQPVPAGMPERLGRYRLLGQLGFGGMGAVYLGLSPDGRLAAVKVVHEHLAQDALFRRRFADEVAASQRVSGAYTAAIMDFDTDAARPWLASVFIPGPSLKTAIADVGPLPAPSLRLLAVGIAAGVEQIHRVNVVHRDLNPNNIMLAEDGPRVIDFGIARAVEGSARLTPTDHVVGTLGYMSPEQLTDRSVGPPSDVFSVGALLVFACSGRKPFGDGTAPVVLNRILLAEADLDAVPLEMQQIVGACLDKNPANRPTPAELARAVGDLEPAPSWAPRALQDYIRTRARDLHAPVSRAVRGQGDASDSGGEDAASRAGYRCTRPYTASRPDPAEGADRPDVVGFLERNMAKRKKRTAPHKLEQESEQQRLAKLRREQARKWIRDAVIQLLTLGVVAAVLGAGFWLGYWLSVTHVYPDGDDGIFDAGALSAHEQGIWMGLLAAFLTFAPMIWIWIALIDYGPPVKRWLGEITGWW